MTTSDTPETNSRAWSDHSEGILHEVVEANFARKLERERDETREKAERYRIEANAMMMQRDEAREELEEYRSIAENIGAKKAVSEKEKAIKERDEWAAMCGRYKQERDDLQKAINGLCEHFKISPANTTLLAVEVLRIERERDEWKNKAYSHATDYTLMEAKCFKLEQQLKEYDKLKS